MASKAQTMQAVAARMRKLGFSPTAVRQVTAPLRVKKALKKSASFHHVTPQEAALMKRLHDEGIGVKKVAASVGRSSDTVSKHVFKKHFRQTTQVGRPVVINEAKFKQLQKGYQKMLREVTGKEVTINMLKRKLKLKCSNKSISRAFWQHGIHFRPLYEKPDLSTSDVKARLAWAEAHKHRSSQQWNRYVHAIIDNKTFQVYHTGQARAYAARRKLRGAYRPRARIFKSGYTKPASKLIQNTGAKSATVTCAIGNGKVLLWHVTVGKWNGAAAERMYSGPLRRALEKEYPNVRGSWRVMEDNDPTGYKSSKGMAAKAATGIATLDLPKRSPDLNPLDFSLWAAVNKKMRQTEAKWPKVQRETRQAYLARLRRTAVSLSADYIRKIVGAMSGRVQQVLDARGHFFPEGGLASWASAVCFTSLQWPGLLGSASCFTCCLSSAGLTWLLVRL